MSHRGVWLVFVACLAFAGNASANADDWAAGQAAFGAGNYADALAHFENARDEGLDGPAVHYNLAVCHFKLEQFERERFFFIQLVERIQLVQRQVV